ncbi:PPIL4 [Bugula neritina]|uniref:Peptidyl-prolyl cis-trans isomerase n=1 Tax=Bugula neritina TaxID=10212 RepID=A0A7J7KTY8_BUGNE|nr:PPIL4 [Bugula neritina]
MAVLLETSVGDLTIDLMTEDRPQASLNFLKLCKLKYYNMCLFHSIQRNLVAQSGDPDGTGRGGQSMFKHLYGDQAVYFEAEAKPRIKHTRKGLVSMVNNGSNMHGSQFFITLADSLDYLDQQGHTVFGEVGEGDEVLDKLNDTFCDKNHQPLQNVRILHTIVLDDPYDDPPGLKFPESSPQINIKDYENDRLEYDDDIDPFKDKTEDEIERIQAEKTAKANAQILEMIGDLPDQDVAPEENVLFVCKLNPVTTEEDLEIIFSRFGAIKSCEVIKDSKTQESLQYAFIEFEKKEYCENAYFKMDNVLIDDRRIHVDFSQSVAKVKWKGKGKGVQTFEKKEKADTKSTAYTGGIYGLNHDDNFASKTHSKGEKAKRQHKSRSRSRHRERSPSLSRKRFTSRERRSRSRDQRKKRRERSRDRSRRSYSREKKYRDRSRDRRRSPPRDSKYRHR